MFQLLLAAIWQLIRIPGLVEVGESVCWCAFCLSWKPLSTHLAFALIQIIRISSVSIFIVSGHISKILILSLLFAHGGHRQQVHPSISQTLLEKWKLADPLDHLDASSPCSNKIDKISRGKHFELIWWSGVSTYPWSSWLHLLLSEILDWEVLRAFLHLRQVCSSVLVLVFLIEAL